MEKGKIIGRGRTAEIYAWGNDRVLKLYLRENRERVEYEATAQRAVYAAGLPVPAVDRVVQLENRHGIIMERISGPEMLAVMKRQPWRVNELARVQAELHARLHNTRVPGLEMSCLRLWAEVARVKTISLPVKQALMQALAGLPEGDTVCHGDFHPMNIIMSPRGPVIIDWLDATRGSPLFDVTRTWLLFTCAMVPAPFPYNLVIPLIRGRFYQEYFRVYRRLNPVDPEQLEGWRTVVVAARLAESIPEQEKRKLDLLVKKGVPNVT